jgi:hypothetical protein
MKTLKKIFVTLLSVLFVIGAVWMLIDDVEQRGEFKLHLGQIDSYPVLTTDAEIAAAVDGEPAIYLVKNYAFNGGKTVKDTVFNVLNGDYLALEIQREVYTMTAHRKTTSREWKSSIYRSYCGNFCFNNGIEINMPADYSFIFSEDKFARELCESNVNSDKLVNIYKSKYYYPDKEVNFGWFRRLFKYIGWRFSVETDFRLDLSTEKEYDNRFSFSYLCKGEPATFAVFLGDGKADLDVFEDGNFMFVGCDSVSGVADHYFEEQSDSIFWDVVFLLICFCAAGYYIYSWIAKRKKSSSEQK